MGSLEFIVPNTMTARLGKTRGGSEAERTLSNTGKRRFLVVEFDDGTPEEHAALLLHLNRRAPLTPLTLAVHSGNASLHGWFFVQGAPEEELKWFLHHAVSLGADQMTWNRSLFTRMPDGRRENGKRQAVFYFNPFAIEARGTECAQIGVT